MAIARAALLLAVAAVLVSGGSDADPATPPALPGQPSPFLGTAVTGYGGLTAAVDAYGDVVDLRAKPAGPPLIDNPATRQAAGTVPADTGIVPRVALGGGPAQPLWRADSVAQRYEPGTNVVLTVARFGAARVIVRTAASALALATTVVLRAPAGMRARATVGVRVQGEARCRSAPRPEGGIELICGPTRVPPYPLRTVFDFATADVRNRLARALPLGSGAPAWAQAMYRRSLLVLFALTDDENGAVAAGARDGWAYVWPRDAATAALAYAAAGLRPDARRAARFLDGLPLGKAARFEDSGAPVPGRGPQGDAAGWVAAADRAAFPARSRPRAAGTAARAALPDRRPKVAGAWRNLPDYQEGAPGNYLGNALAATWAAQHPVASVVPTGSAAPTAGTTGPEGADGAPRLGALGAFVTPRGLVRVAGHPASGLDSAAAWAVRPFAAPALYPAARRTLLRLARQGTRFGITPGEGWTGGEDPWTAPTAASVWALAALGERTAALRLLGDLRRAATPAGDLPERVDASSGIPRSTTPLAWTHGFAILALQQLWPGHRPPPRAPSGG
jgi:glucoamylase